MYPAPSVNSASARPRSSKPGCGGRSNGTGASPGRWPPHDGQPAGDSLRPAGLRLSYDQTSGTADPLRFHVEAGVAACHAKAASYATTDWGEILALYDALSETSPSPVVDVNRVLAVAMCRGAMAGLDELDAIPERELITG